MKKYMIAIEETCIQEFSVLAENVDEAHRISREKYRNGTFVLDPGELVSTSIGVFDADKNDMTWEDYL